VIRKGKVASRQNSLFDQKSSGWSGPILPFMLDLGTKLTEDLGFAKPKIRLLPG
jgi:hypothetical protein